MSQLFLDQLDSERKRVFDKLAAFADTFVLAGGTAIMLQIGHRKSYVPSGRSCGKQSLYDRQAPGMDRRGNKEFF